VTTIISHLSQVGVICPPKTDPTAVLGFGHNGGRKDGKTADQAALY